jgi:hypothetical protein
MIERILSEPGDQPAEPSLHETFLTAGRHRAAEERCAIRALRSAEIVETQLIPWGSNYTFAAVMQPQQGPTFLAIYKPEQGESPLWDFPDGTLYQREYASYLLSRFLGWRFIPPTVIREGPYGIGTVQLYIEPIRTGRDQRNWRPYQDQLQQVALFDVITNNADRKAGHFFLGRHQRRIWGIDHGLTFHVHPKLRTVLWDFCGESLDPTLAAAVRRIDRHQSRLLSLLDPYLTVDEILMLLVRAERVLNTGVFPLLNPRRNIPYGW